MLISHLPNQVWGMLQESSTLKPMPQIPCRMANTIQTIAGAHSSIRYHNVRNEPVFLYYLLRFAVPAFSRATNVLPPPLLSPAGVVCGTGGEESGLLPSLHRVGVALLAFSPDGLWLASMGHEPMHMLAVYRRERKKWRRIRTKTDSPQSRE